MAKKKSKSEKTMKIKSSWSEVTLREFIKIGEVGNDPEMEGRSVLQVAHLVAILSETPMDQIMKMDRTMFEPMIKAIEFTKKDPPKRNNEPFEIDGRLFQWVPDFSLLTLGEQISIEQCIKDAEENEVNALPQIMAVILRPVVDGKLMDFDAAFVDEHPSLFLDHLTSDKFIHEINFISAIVQS